MRIGKDEAVGPGGSGGERPDEDVGGDPVCWVELTCPECGAMPSAEQPERCWRCGRPRSERPAEPC